MSSMMDLEQQVHPFLKWYWGRTKDPTNRINALIRADLVVTTLQACQEVLKDPFVSPTSA